MHTLSRLLLALALLCPDSAHAQISGRAAGPWLDIGVGLGAGDLPFSAGVGWTAAIGGWFGRYDDSFAIGRHVGIGARVRQDVQLHAGREELRTALLLDVHRGIDLLLVGLRAGGTAGPLVRSRMDTHATEIAGATVRATGDLIWRARPHLGVDIRLDVGVDIDRGRGEPALGLTFGLAWMRPAQR